MVHKPLLEPASGPRASANPERFAIDGLPGFAAAARQRRAELHARADRLDPLPPMFVPASPGPFLPVRRP